jgi:hypothetical protein
MLLQYGPTAVPSTSRQACGTPMTLAASELSAEREGLGRRSGGVRQEGGRAKGGRRGEDCARTETHC